MPALATLVLVWLGAEKPDGRVKSALDAFAAEQGATLEEPRPEPGSDRGEVEQPLAEQCDRWLDLARDQLNGGDDAAAQRTLRQLEQALRERPRLVQASWLMAERYRVEAQIAARTSPNDAASWHAQADSLEGDRALSFGDSGVGRGSPSAKIPIVLTVHGTRQHETYWDGARTADETALAAGEHHLLIVRGKKVAWADWVSVFAPGKIDVWVADTSACSAEDLEGVALRGSAALTVPAGVRCSAWAAAAPGPARGTLTLTLCRHDQCQPSITWIDEGGARPRPGTLPTTGLIPPWATWTLAGVGVAAATSIILWRTGTFEPSPSSRVLWDGSKL